MDEGLLTLPNLPQQCFGCLLDTDCLRLRRDPECNESKLKEEAFPQHQKQLSSNTLLTTYTLPGAIIKKGIILTSIVVSVLWSRV
jgi:hypothetical protein